MKKEIASWVTIAVTTAALWAFVGVLFLHLGLRLKWRDLAIALPLFTLVQIVGMTSLVGFQRTRNSRALCAVFGAWALASGLIAMHYGSHWGVAKIDGNDFWQFSASTIVLTIVAIVIFPRVIGVGIEDAGIKCATCHHRHEGRDCNCGCRADQFKYAPFSI